MDQATTLATLKQAIAALYAPQTTQRTRQEADAFLQAFVRSGFGACLESCGALPDDPASSRAELLFATHATHRTVRHCVFKPGAAQRPQRSHVVMDDATYARFRGRLAARAGLTVAALHRERTKIMQGVLLKEEWSGWAGWEERYLVLEPGVLKVFASEAAAARRPSRRPRRRAASAASLG